MSRAECAVSGCGRPTPDQAYVCTRCAQLLAADVRDVPWLLVELEATRLGLTRLATSGSGGEPPVPWVQRAALVAAELANVVTTWARAVSEERGVPIRAGRPALPAGPVCDYCEHRSCAAARRIAQPWPGPVAVAAGWLLASGGVEWLRHHQAGPEAVDGIGKAVRMARAVVDRPADRWYAGRCGAEVPSDSVAARVVAAVFGCAPHVECQAELYGPPTAKVITCRDCGTEWPATERRTWLLRHAEHYLLTAAELCRALPNLLGRELNVKTVRGWAWTGRLVEHGRTDEGRPLYQVGEVIALAYATPQRNRVGQKITQSA